MKRHSIRALFLLLTVLCISLTVLAVTDEINRIAEQADKLYVQKRYSESFPLMKRAAEGGDEISMFNLGTMYYEGQGTSKDFDQARYWWQKAANLGDNEAKKLLKRLDEEQSSSSLSDNKNFTITSIAEQAHNLYAQKRYSEAFLMMKYAAESGDVISMLNLGTMYYEGQGIDKNPVLARRWWQEAAKHGDTEAEIHLKCLDEAFQNLWNKMVYIEGGSFVMGATAEQDKDAYSDEKLAHIVTVSSYYISKFEVTQAEWVSVMGSNPSSFKGDNLPVENVSWNDCQEFLRKLNSLTGKNFRLPTEAEWEYAARGGAKGLGCKYAGANTIENVSWYEGNSGSKTHAIGTKSPNELGLYDMSGNVWEWCQDWYGDYSSSAQTNPTGSSSGSDRVYRGGSWSNSARNCRVSDRNGHTPAYRSDCLGLRLAL